jgi:hypothetical protein
MGGIGKAVGRWRLLVAAVALAAALGLVAMATAQTDRTSKPARMALDEDLMKLAVVVMANHTPITQADAKAVLPALEAIQAGLGEAKAGGAPPDDAAIAALDAGLQAALSPTLRNAVAAVRLLTPPVPPAPDTLARRPEKAGPRDEARLGPPSGGPGRGQRGGGPRGPRGGHRGPGGMLGHGVLGPLVDFFRSTAGV